MMLGLIDWEGYESQTPFDPFAISSEKAELHFNELLELVDGRSGFVFEHSIQKVIKECAWAFAPDFARKCAEDFNAIRVY